MEVRPSRGRVTDFIPTYWNISSVVLSGTEMEYRPSRSVMLPIVVPGTTTVAPGRLEPSSAEVITPVISICPNAIWKPPRKIQAIANAYFLIS